MDIQQRMRMKLEQLGLPAKQIQVYGRQIVITSTSRDTAIKWAGVLAKFAKVRGVIETLDEAAANRNTVLRPSMVRVWRTFAQVTA